MAQVMVESGGEPTVRMSGSAGALNEHRVWGWVKDEIDECQKSKVEAGCDGTQTETVLSFDDPF